jgi:hypothetical protein
MYSRAIAEHHTGRGPRGDAGSRGKAKALAAGVRAVDRLVLPAGADAIDARRAEAELGWRERANTARAEARRRLAAVSAWRAA